MYHFVLAVMIKYHISNSFYSHGEQEHFSVGEINIEYSRTEYICIAFNELLGYLVDFTL